MHLIYTQNMIINHSKSECIGSQIYELACKIFPICRSITGQGNRKTLKILSDNIPLSLFEIPSGTKVFDWTIPQEWNIEAAYLEDETGRRIIDFQNNNLHVINYSIAVDCILDLQELQNHLYSREDLPEAIPYVTSYYTPRWGFCISHNQRKQLSPGKYHAVIKSRTEPGSLTYGELILPGRSEKEIFLSTYICHPSMANNEVSGPSVLTWLTKWILSEPKYYTYRIIFVPETIGSIAYLARHSAEMKRNMIAGFNITCVGDDRDYSYIPSRSGSTLADKTALYAMRHHTESFHQYRFLDRGSDERQYCFPGIDLPVVTLCRSKFGTYPEYHTSLDNLDLIRPKGLEGAFNLLKICLEILEENKTYLVQTLCEPHLGKYNLYPMSDSKTFANWAYTGKKYLNILAYADGTNDLIDLSTRTEIPVRELISMIHELKQAGLITEINSEPQAEQTLEAKEMFA